MVLVSLPKKPCLYRNLHGFYGSNTKGLVETRGVSIEGIQFSPLPTTKTLANTGVTSPNDWIILVTGYCLTVTKP